MKIFSPKRSGHEIRALLLGGVSALVLIAASPSLALDAGALPSGGAVVGGDASLDYSTPNALHIHQSTDRVVIDWDSFNIGQDALTQFHQNSSSSLAVNRVTGAGQDPTQILGQLKSNGQVMVLDRNGVIFGADSRVDVGGIMASTGDVNTNAVMSGGSVQITGIGAGGAITNAGTITVHEAGLAAFVAPNVTNDGIIQARLGRVQIGAGSQATIDLYGDGLMELALDEGRSQALINTGLIMADGGQIQIEAAAAKDIVDNLIQNTGTLTANAAEGTADGRIILTSHSAEVIEGASPPSTLRNMINTSGALEARSIEIDGDRVALSGMLTAHEEPTKGGQIAVKAHMLTQQAMLEASGSQQGGSIKVRASGNYSASSQGKMDVSSSAGKGGTIDVQATSDDSHLFTSGDYKAGGATEGGSIKLSGKASTKLFAAKASATGGNKGGEILVGGGYQGQNTAIINSAETVMNGASVIDSSATQVGGTGGLAVVWSEDRTRFMGTAKATGGGMIEVSSKETLTIGDQSVLDVSNLWGLAGSVLLDPKNITIASGGATSDLSFFEFIDPNINGTGFGDQVVTLSNGNVVITDTADNAGAANAGAAYLFNGTTGALISTLTGSTANDMSGSIINTLTNGNYLVRSQNWDNGAIANAGAVTWGSGTSGVSGVISAANSLVGSTANDQLGNGGVTPLSNGNYLVQSSQWDNGAVVDAGAVTWGNGITGTVGVVSAANSLVGSTTNDGIGSGTITVLSNGNYLVRSSNWDNGLAINAGAVTWGNGTSGVSGVISAANSLVGGAFDFVGNGNITVLSNGNYVIQSNNWGYSEGITQAGAVTWGSGTSGVSGVVSAANSLVGSAENDFVGNGNITALTNGNYVVRSSQWNNNRGAVTWGSGTSGVSGVLSAANSLVGSTAYDSVGVNSAITLLNNGNYLVYTPWWDNGAIVNAGAVTWGSGTSGVSGVISAANSLIGSTANDMINPGITTLSNGNYLVRSAWIDQRGAVTWGSGTSGVSGVVSAANSLVGSTANDQVGSGVITVLTNGNYVVSSSSWDNGAVVNAGAVTWGNGTTGITGTLSAVNSLVGSTASDLVGLDGITALTNGNYVVRSTRWNSNRGAVTWGSGTSGVSGLVSAANSLVGSTANDYVGSSGITALSNSNYVVRSFQWDNGAIVNAGAVTWGNGTTGIVGVINAVNSLVGSTANDQVGNGGITLLSNGNYVLSNQAWNGNRGAVTWGNGTTGIVGQVSAANSLVGSTANDRVGNAFIIVLNNGNYVVHSQDWNGNRGAVTWGNGTTGIVGEVSAANSLVGSTVNDWVGRNESSTTGITALSNGNYVVHSTSWNGNRGAVTWGSGTNGVSGVLSAANSLVGSTTGDGVGIGAITTLNNGNYLVRSSQWDNCAIVNAGAVTWGSGTSGVSGVISAANSLVGSTLNDMSGMTITALSNGNYLVRNTLWNNGATADAGAVTWGSGTSGVSGVISAANSLVGSTLNDMSGMTITTLSNGNYLVRSPNWDNGGIVDAGAATLASGTSGISGTISAGNSIIGAAGVVRLNAFDQTAVNGRTVVSIDGRVYSAVLGQPLTYGASAGSDITLSPTFLTNLLNTGAAVTLQANNDIFVNNDVIANNAGGDGGWLTLQAGRSILLNANITTDNGNLTLIGNDNLAGGVVDIHRDAGAAVITQAAGTSINAGTGAVNIELRAGTGKTHSVAGDITLRAINAASLFVRSFSTVSDILLNGILSLSGAGTALELVAGDDLINNHGAGVFNLTGGGRFLTWSDDPLEDTGEEHFSAPSAARYNRNFGDVVELTGNIRNYSSAEPAPIVSSVFIPSSVMRSMQSLQITAPFNFYTPQNTTVLYDYYSGQKVAEISENITLDPEMLSQLGLIQINRSEL